MANWRYDVVLGAEYIQLVYTGTGDSAQIIHYRTVIDAVAHVKYKYVYDTYSGGNDFTPLSHNLPPQVVDISSTANNATLSQDAWPDPNDLTTLSTSQLPSTLFKENGDYQQWFVRLRYNDGRFLDLPMGKIDNQAGWTNDQVGSAACLDDILGACITP
ncbi:MAG: hypothetical protein ACK54F_03405 [Planctomycetia bacterium]|jgi:hypothetical protein